MRLIFDFDGTITEKDTISTLAGAALAHQNDRHGEDLGAVWDEVVKRYVSDCKQYSAGYEVPEAERRTAEEELAFLGGSGDVERASLKRIRQSGVFRGLEEKQLFEMGRGAASDGTIALRDGAGELMRLAGERGWTVGVISVNWSRAFIAGALDGLIPLSSIVANEFAPDGTVQGPKSLSGHPLTNGTGKLAVFDEDRSLQPTGEATSGPTIYFGDSTTDMECLLHGGGEGGEGGGGGGIAVASSEDDSSLIKTLRRVGLPVPHVGAAAMDAEAKTSGVYWARDFREVIDSNILARLGLK